MKFSTRAGESVDEARARLDTAFLAARWQLDIREAAATSSGRAPRRDTSYLRTWGRWFYEARVRQPATPTMTLARENHAALEHPGRFEDHDCRKQVSAGIKEAERLLGLVPDVFRPGK